MRSSFSIIGCARISRVRNTAAPCTALNGSPDRYTVPTASVLITELMVNNVHVSGKMGPMRTQIIPPPMSAVTSRFPLVITPALQRYPAKSPASPKANICHGVHAPCPNMKLLTKALMLPVIKPACGPRAIPQIMTIPTIGLNCGNIINAAREATAIAHITAISNFLVLGLRLSKLSQNAATRTTKPAYW